MCETCFFIKGRTAAIQTREERVLSPTAPLTSLEITLRPTHQGKWPSKVFSSPPWPAWLWPRPLKSDRTVEPCSKSTLHLPRWPSNLGLEIMTVAVSSQCGGIGWSGVTCCASGSACNKVNDYYSQCLPGSAASSSTAATTSRTTTTAAPSSTTTRVTTSSTSKASTTSAGSATTTVKPSTTIPGGAGTTASYSGNPFQGVNQWANSYYASEVSSLAIPSLSAAMATKAAAVAKVPSFQWL